MDAKYLQEIKERVEGTQLLHFFEDVNPDIVYEDAPVLVAEVERLQEENRCLRANIMMQEQIISRDGKPFDKDKIVTTVLKNSMLTSENVTLKRALKIMAMDMLGCERKDLQYPEADEVVENYIQLAQEEQS